MTPELIAELTAHKPAIPAALAPPAAEARRQKVLALLARDGTRHAVHVEDPNTDPSAQFISEISHQAAIEQRLGVMDSTALSLCMDNALPIYVFNMNDERNIDRIVCGERVGTVVRSG